MSDDNNKPAPPADVSFFWPTDQTTPPEAATDGQQALAAELGISPAPALSDDAAQVMHDAQAIAPYEPPAEEVQDLVQSLADLDPRELRFLASYIRHGVRAQAARESGYGNRAVRSQKLERAIRLTQRNVAARINFGLVEAIQELIDLGKKSVDAGEFMAAVRALETKIRVAGLLQPENQGQQVPSVNIIFQGIDDQPPRAIIEGQANAEDR